MARGPAILHVGRCPVSTGVFRISHRISRFSLSLCSLDIGSCSKFLKFNSLASLCTTSMAHQRTACHLPLSQNMTVLHPTHSGSSNNTDDNLHGIIQQFSERMIDCLLLHLLFSKSCYIFFLISILFRLSVNDAKLSRETQLNRREAFTSRHPVL